MGRLPHLLPPKRLARVFHVTVKPIGWRCNLDCAYCYYLHKENLLPEATGDCLGEDLLEEFIRRYIAEHEGQTVQFAWHGGEPTLLGLDYFRKAVALEQKYAGGKQIENSLQTNGLLVDDAWCGFFRENRFLIGLSIDGPKPLHDSFRVSRGGSPSFDQVLYAARLLRFHKVHFNTLTVIHAASARQPAEVYRFLTEEVGSQYLQWLPCVEHKDFRTRSPGQWDPAEMPLLGTPAARPGQPDSVVTDWSVDPDDWGEFLCQTFDLWRQRDLGRIAVNWYESLVAQWMRQPSQLCTLAETCGRSIALEKDGSLYSCDRFVYPEYRLGNLRDPGNSLAETVYSLQQRRFGCAKRDRLTKYCKECPWRFACNGDCPKNRFVKTPDGQPGLSYLCPGMKRFLAHANPYLRRIAAEIHRVVPP